MEDAVVVGGDDEISADVPFTLMSMTYMCVICNTLIQEEIVFANIVDLWLAPETHISPCATCGYRNNDFVLEHLNSLMMDMLSNTDENVFRHQNAANVDIGDKVASSSEFLKQHSTVLTDFSATKEKVCPICIESSGSDKSLLFVALNVCGHEFHEECLKSWLDTGMPDCPMCRKKIDG